MGTTIRFAPIDVGRWLVWGATAVVFALLPLVFSSGFAITLLSQMGIMIIFALSYNMIFGQGGMLSFGHAVYSGLGAFFAIHALNWIGQGHLWMPVSLVPLVGGVFAALYLASGSLLVPMVLHVLMDLRALLIRLPPDAPHAAASGPSTREVS